MAAAFPPVYPVQMVCYQMPQGGVPATAPLVPATPSLVPTINSVAAQVPPTVATNTAIANNASPKSTINHASNTISKASSVVKRYGPAVGTAAKLAGKAVPGLSQAILAAEIAGEYGPKAASFAKSAFSRKKNNNASNEIAKPKQNGGSNRKMVRSTRRRVASLRRASLRRVGGKIVIPNSPASLSPVNTYTSWPGGVDPTSKLFNQKTMVGGAESPELKAYKASVKMLAALPAAERKAAYGVLYRNLYEHQSMGGPEYENVNAIPVNDKKKLSNVGKSSLDYALKICNRLDSDEIITAGEALDAAFPANAKGNDNAPKSKGGKRSTRRKMRHN